MEELEKQLYTKALNLLTSREHGVEELKGKLLLKSENKALVGKVIEKLINENYLNDERYSQCFIESRANRGYGPMWIKSALRNKNVSKEIIDKIFAEVEINWVKVADKVKRKKYGLNKINNEKDIYKQKSFLKMRGFTIEQIQKLYNDDIFNF